MGEGEAARSFDENRPIRSLPFDEERPIGGGGAAAYVDENSLAEHPAEPEAQPWKLAALNYNTSRTPGAAYDESTDGKLGSVYTALTEKLIARGDWKRLPALRNKETDEVKLPTAFHLLLGTAQGKGIRWGRLGYGMWPPPLVNYVRGFDVLTRKGKLVSTLAQGRDDAQGELPAGLSPALTAPAAAASPAGAAAGAAAGAWDLAPQSFVFHPSKGEANPTEALRTAYAEAAAEVEAAAAEAGGEAGAGAAANLWILKPSDGSKGNNISIYSSLEEIEAFLAAQEERAAAGEAVSSWVVQRYVANPLLLDGGGRKFDMRCWVLLDSEYNIHLYRQGVLRTSAVAYDASDVTNRFAHLTNHCIATEHGDYGKFEATNELFYDAFDQELSRRFPEQAAAYGGSVLEGRLLPQIRRHVVLSLLAARERLESSGDYYRPFHLFGYDFLVDADLRIWLCEINASPAVAEQLLPAFVDSLVATAIDPVFPPVPALQQAKLAKAGPVGGADQPSAPAAAEAGEVKREGFELLFRANKPQEEE